MKVKLTIAIFLLLSFPMLHVFGSNGDRGSDGGGDEISGLFARRAQLILDHLKSLNSTKIDTGYMQQSFEEAEILKVDMLYNLETDEPLAPPFQSLRAWSEDGVIQLKEDDSKPYWKEILKNPSSGNELIAHELFRLAGYSDGSHSLSVREFHLDKWTASSHEPPSLSDMEGTFTLVNPAPSEYLYNLRNLNVYVGERATLSIRIDGSGQAVPPKSPPESECKKSHVFPPPDPSVFTDCVQKLYFNAPLEFSCYKWVELDRRTFRNLALVKEIEVIKFSPSLDQVNVVLRVHTGERGTYDSHVSSKFDFVTFIYRRVKK